MGIVVKCAKCGFVLLKFDNGEINIPLELKKNYTIVRGGKKSVRCPKCLREINPNEVKKIILYRRATKRDVIKSGRNISRLRRLTQRRKRKKIGEIDLEEWNG